MQLNIYCPIFVSDDVYDNWHLLLAFITKFSSQQSCQSLKQKSSPSATKYKNIIFKDYFVNQSTHMCCLGLHCLGHGSVRMPVTPATAPTLQLMNS